jgi:hypothetical protein
VSAAHARSIAAGLTNALLTRAITPPDLRVGDRSTSAEKMP